MPRRKQPEKSISDSRHSEKVKRAALPLQVDLAAQRRLRAIIELAIAIGRREGLIGNKGENTDIDKGK